MGRVDWPYAVSSTGILHVALFVDAFGKGVRVETACAAYGKILYGPKSIMRRTKTRGVPLCKTCFGLRRSGRRKQYATSDRDGA